MSFRTKTAKTDADRNCRALPRTKCCDTYHLVATRGEGAVSYDTFSVPGMARVVVSSPVYKVEVMELDEARAHYKARRAEGWTKSVPGRY